MHTICYGKNNLIGVYKDNKLVATHDKFTKGNGDFDRFMARLDKAGETVTEQQADFSKFTEIPQEIKASVPETEPEAPEEPAEKPKAALKAETGKFTKK